MACNYYIDRDVLAHILKYNYNLHVVYDRFISVFSVNFTIIKIRHYKMVFVTVRKNAQKKVQEKGKISVLKYLL